MDADQWWLSERHPDISQGDVIKGLRAWVANPPLVFLQKHTLPGNKTVWVESTTTNPDENGFSHLLIRAREIAAVVLTHDCQLDKMKRRARVQLAVASDIERLNSEEKTVVMNQRSLSMLVLPNIPQIGTYYADMRLIFTVDKRLISEAMRIASMTEEAKMRLQNQIIAYFADRARPNTEVLA